MHTLLSLMVLSASIAAAPVPDRTEATLQRYTLVIGANYGGGDREMLKYAVSDAERFAGVMVELGGVAPANQIVLKQPKLRELFAALDQVTARLAAARRSGGAAGGRTELVLYYSGHADEKGLLLGEDRVSYQSLRDKLDDMPADVRIAVLDACASGAFTRLKGGVARPPFRVDASLAMRGHAFLTSSAETEAAQESDRIGASYFTHYLISAFRGAADTSGDGRVTLNEAYQFAFAETLGRTVGTKGGAQHPSYDINLSGTGDVVMTDMRQTTAALLFGEDVSGRIYVRNSTRQLVAELHKPAGRIVELGLEPGIYDVWLDRDRSAFSVRAQAAPGNRAPIDMRRFAPAAAEQTRRRGGDSNFAVAGRTRVAFENGLWGDRGFVNVAGRRFDIFGGVQVARFLSEAFAVTAGFEAYGAEADIDVFGGIAVPLTVQWNPAGSSARRLKPFVSLGGILVSRTENGSRWRDTSIGVQAGTGIEFYVTPSFSLTAKGAHNMINLFGGYEFPSNFKGTQFSLAAGWTFGK